MESKVKESVLSSGYSEKHKRIREKALKEASFGVVMGNESCDQDSFVGAHILGVVEERVPVVNLQREIFQHKRDLMVLAEMMGLGLDDLVFLEKRESGWVLVCGQMCVRVADVQVSATIIDHNLPNKELLAMKGFRVDRVIDHHPILEMNAMYTQLDKLQIELKAGSCCSLIYKEIKSRHGQEIVSKPGEYRFLVLLSLPVLTDTSELSDRTHDVDRCAVKELVELGGVTREDVNALYHLLKKEKRNIDGAPTAVILQMDFKTFEFPPNCAGKVFGISSAKYPFDNWVAREGDKFLPEIKKFATARHHEFFLINNHNNGVRELFLLGNPGPDFVQEVMFAGGPVNQREVAPGVVVYTVEGTLSRKLIAPRIYTYLSKHCPNTK
ncbi:exopolyphosphatase [Nematocida homosporus]|uniref:exopolyphosphatase n=1 Tax=Nematocida homosporus TaxID=1912981 RepID=UPI00221F92D8|nr:exopolyphosphatase [Nematocida homosporus]KAI5184417.1 exopolyphosphatase [Nematocida homosporus]